MNDRPLIPVYLNQRFVFDLLAMLQGGISTVSSVSSTAESERGASTQVRATFGLADAIASLLKVDLSAGKDSRTAAKDVQSSKEERIHTPASLFYQLRSILKSRGELKQISSNAMPAAGDLVEFEAALTRNPALGAFDALSSMLEFAEELERIPTAGTPNAQKSKKLQPVSQTLTVKQQVMMLLRHLRTGETIDLSANLPEEVSAVLTLEIPSLSDPTLSNLVDGRFAVLGKVIRSVEPGGPEISFLRKTPLATLPRTVLDPLSDAFAAIATEHGIKLPSLSWGVAGPAIHVLPVAIYA